MPQLEALYTSPVTSLPCGRIELCATAHPNSSKPSLTVSQLYSPIPVQRQPRYTFPSPSIHDHILQPTVLTTTYRPNKSLAVMSEDHNALLSQISQLAGERSPGSSAHLMYVINGVKQDKSTAARTSWSRLRGRFQLPPTRGTQVVSPPTRIYCMSASRH
jgi:hypothetical protein